MSLMAAAYARVSTDRQAEAQTIEQQVERLVTYARERGWHLESQHIYRDEGYSGARLDRPALDRLRDAVATGQVDTILISSPDRLARRYAYQVWILEEFENCGCQVVFLERPPTGDPQDSLLIQIRGAVAEYERTLIADRMRRGRLAAMRLGKLLPWSTAAYGYQLDPEHPRDPASLRVDEVAAKVVRDIYVWYVQEGYSLYQVAQRLTEQGVPTARRAIVWNASSVRKILTNTCYTGTAYGNQKQVVPARRHHPLVGRERKGEGGKSCKLRPRGEWIAIAVPAIVTEAMFEQAQERLERNKRQARRNTKGEYLLRALVSCGLCGLAHGVYSNGRYSYYRCRGMGTFICRGGHQRCHAPQVPTARLDEVVWQDVCELLSDGPALEEAMRQAQRGWLSGEERQAQSEDVRRRQAVLERQLERLLDAYQADLVTLEELGQRRARLEQRLAGLRRESQELLAARVQDEQMRAVAGELEGFRASVAQSLATATFAQRRQLVELLIDRVVVNPPEVEIRYVIPLTGLAQRKGVLRPHHRATQQRAQAAQRRGRHLSQ